MDVDVRGCLSMWMIMDVCGCLWVRMTVDDCSYGWMWMIGHVDVRRCSWVDVNECACA